MGGIDTLNEMEKIEVDNRDKPIENIVLEKTQVFVDPFQEADEQLEQDRAEEIERQRKEIQEAQKKKQRSQPLKIYRDGVGKYLNKGDNVVASSATTSTVTSAESTGFPAKKVKKSGNYAFKDFSSW